MKRQILALAKREPSNEELQKIKQSLAVYKNLTIEEQSKINKMVKDAHAKLESEGKFAKGGTTKTQSLKTALTDLKNKVGVKKFKRATTGTDIKKDIAIPALKGGKRIVRKKGKTTNEYGTFKNQVGTTYYESRANRSDVNQPSQTRKIKLADGGTTTSLSSIKRKYYKNEDENAHSENVVLLAKHFGDAEDLKLAKQILARHNEEGSLSSENGKKRNDLHLKLIEKARVKFGEEGIEFAKGGEMDKKSAKFKVGDKVYSYQNKSESAPIAYVKFSAWDSENGAHLNDVWKYKLSLKDGYSNWINEESLSETPQEKYAKGGEVSQYIDGLSKQEVLSKTIVYDNGGESYDRYTIFTPDGSVYGMSETAEGFNQYIGDSSEIEKGKHLGKKLRSVPKGIQGAVLDRMLDDEQMFAKGGKLSKEDALEKAIDMGVDFDKDFHAQSVGNELAELAKDSGYKKSPSSSGSTGRAFFYHLQKIYDKKKFSDGGNVRDWSISDVNNAKYLGVIEFQDNQEEYHNFEIMETDDRLVFGSFTNSGFIESGYIEKDGMSTDETLQNLLEDLEVYYNDGAQYTSMIVFNQRMANGGKLRSKAKYIPNRNIDEIEVTRNGKTTSIDGANLLDGVYVKKGTKFADGGKVLSKNYLYEISTPFPSVYLAEELEELFGQRRLILGDYNSSEALESVIMLNLTQDEIEKIQSKIEDAILFRTEITNLEGMWLLNKYAQGGTIKKSLAEFKNKVGASKYREATRGVDIKADLQIPALKKGRRVVTKRGKTSNQYGTFKNKVGSVYYENRPNHYDVNQPSEKRKIKLADGGQVMFVKNFTGKDGIEISEGKTTDGKTFYTANVISGALQKIIPMNENKNYVINRAKAIYKSMLEFKKTDDYRIYYGKDAKYAQGGTFADGGVLEGAKIYVADLAEYNDGRLVGKWFDLSDYSDASELMVAIQEMLDEQTAKDKNGEVHEEWAVHDFEGFPRSFYSEYMGEKDFEKLYQIAEVANDRGLPIDVLMEAVADFGADEDQIERIAEAYYTSIPASMGNESRDFAYEYIDSIGSITDAVSNPDFYFDYESFGSDARMDYSDEDLEEYGYDELDDTELGERLVDEMGGIEQLGDKTIEMYFDYDKFGRDLEYDFTSVRGDDGNFYYFSSNW
jgi:antirestriction protein